MSTFDRILDWLGRQLARGLSEQPQESWPFAPSDPEALRRTLRPGDVILISGADRISKSIKYLTQWSHAAIYVGEMPETTDGNGEPHALVEVNLGEGCISAPLSKYARAHTRICRAATLSDEERTRVATYMKERIGLDYDLRNILDLALFSCPCRFPSAFAAA